VISQDHELIDRATSGNSLLRARGNCNAAAQVSRAQGHRENFRHRRETVVQREVYVTPYPISVPAVKY
jgi:hypothetical protein